jgi:hypothetical protein
VGTSEEPVLARARQFGEGYGLAIFALVLQQIVGALSDDPEIRRWTFVGAAFSGVALFVIPRSNRVTLSRGVLCVTYQPAFGPFVYRERPKTVVTVVLDGQTTLRLLDSEGRSVHRARYSTASGLVHDLRDLESRGVRVEGRAAEVLRSGGDGVEP